MNHELFFGTDVRFANLIYLPAISDDDAEEIFDNLEDFISALGDASRYSSAEVCDFVQDEPDVIEWIEEEGIDGYAAYACTPVPNLSSCGKFVSDYSWGWYSRQWVFAKTMEELKEKALHTATEFRRQRIKAARIALEKKAEQGGEA